MSISTDLLAPRPRQATLTDELLDLSGPLGLSLEGDPAAVEAGRRKAEDIFARLGHDLTAADSTTRDDRPTLRLSCREGAALGTDAYGLEVTASGVDISASSASGLYYGVATLEQWVRIHEAEQAGVPRALHGLEVEDSPGFRHRGVMLDISRNRVPTMETLYSLVDRLADWKINQLQLYTEHTFAYRGHEAVWHDASPMTAEEMQALDCHCNDRFIELVPNQQSFGHMHRWLVHEPYRRLAECPEGVQHPFSSTTEPFSLCPTEPAVVELLSNLYAELLPNFSSRQLNVGLDETFDLGMGRSKSDCDTRGRPEVYLDFLGKVHDLARAHGRRIQFWADIVLEHAELVHQIPTDAVVLNWGYEADHPFADETARLAAAGLEFYVCPGTSSWNSFAGRASNALGNLASAAQAGNEHGAAGYLITDWGDNGHLQPLPVSYLGFLAGASMAWNPSTADSPDTLDWPRLLDLYAFDGAEPGIGHAAIQLANAYLRLGAQTRNGTALFHLVMSPDDTLEHPRYEGLTASGLESVTEAAREVGDRMARTARSHGDTLEISEFAWIADALTFGARVGLARLEAGRSAEMSDLAKGIRSDLRHDIGSLIERLPSLWQKRGRLGGLDKSLARLERVRRLFD
ncbi:MAG: family 20 glycosylhydrolase [Acidobacteriota bacterium]|nr:family 20 glycosylhydrolase [Acidobacteriota bacterium]